MRKLFQVIAVCLLSISSVYAELGPVDKAKENILAKLSPTLQGVSQAEPLFILIGGHVGSGKTTLSNALKERYGITVFSLNSIRQAMLDEGIDIRKNKQEERAILFDIYPKLLAPCVGNLQHIVIDANANRQGIIDALQFLKEHQGGERYKMIKICLRASKEELEKRVHARVQHASLHQGTIADLEYELNTLTKAVYPEDYDLVIDTENTPFEVEMEMVRRLLQP